MKNTRNMKQKNCLKTKKNGRLKFLPREYINYQENIYMMKRKIALLHFQRQQKRKYFSNLYMDLNICTIMEIWFQAAHFNARAKNNGTYVDNFLIRRTDIVFLTITLLLVMYWTSVVTTSFITQTRLRNQAIVYYR